MLDKSIVDFTVAEWMISWKEKSAQRILAICSDSFERMPSPYAGEHCGKASVEKHWEGIIQSSISNNFKIIDVLFCVDTMCIYYQFDSNRRAMDWFKFDSEHKIVAITSSYTDDVSLQDSATITHSPINKQFAIEIAKDWQESWNAHDLDRILSHYTEDFTMTTPFIAQMGQDPTGTLHGKGAVGAYWEKALQRFPDLHFELLDVLFTSNTVCVYYHSVLGLRAVEWLKFHLDGVSGPYLVCAASGSYNAMP